jgi:hypothetical protein
LSKIRSLLDKYRCQSVNLSRINDLLDKFLLKRKDLSRFDDQPANLKRQTRVSIRKTTYRPSFSLVIQTKIGKAKKTCYDNKGVFILLLQMNIKLQEIIHKIQLNKEELH